MSSKPSLESVAPNPGAKCRLASTNSRAEDWLSFLLIIAPAFAWIPGSLPTLWTFPWRKFGMSSRPPGLRSATLPFLMLTLRALTFAFVVFLKEVQSRTTWPCPVHASVPLVEAEVYPIVRLGCEQVICTIDFSPKNSESQRILGDFLPINQANCKNGRLPSWIFQIHRIAVGIKVRVQILRVGSYFPVFRVVAVVIVIVVTLRIPAHEPSGDWVVISGAEVVEP